MATIAARIKEARIKKGWSQGELAAAAGVTVTAISRYELGQRVPRAEVLHAIADALEVPTSALTESPVQRHEQLEGRVKILSGLARKIEKHNDPELLDEFNQYKALVEKDLNDAISQSLIDDQAQVNTQKALSRESKRVVERKYVVKSHLRTERRIDQLIAIFTKLSEDEQQTAIERMKELKMLHDYRCMVKDQLPAEEHASDTRDTSKFIVKSKLYRHSDQDGDKK